MPTRHGPVPREAAWTDGIADYVLTAYPGSNESTDDALHRVV